MIRHMQPCRSRRRVEQPLRTVSAFTLIELMVVVAVVMLLSTLLSPLLQQARERVFRLVCMNNLRQAYDANVAYAADHGGLLPGYVATDAQDGGCSIKHYNVTKWGHLYPTYLKDIGILFCPSRRPGTRFARQAGEYHGYDTFLNPARPFTETSYGQVTGTAAEPINLNRLTSPATKVMAFDFLLREGSRTWGASACHGNGYYTVMAFDGHVVAFVDTNGYLETLSSPDNVNKGIPYLSTRLTR